MGTMFARRLDRASPEEHAFSRPCVLKDGGRYRMWYAFRGASYRLVDELARYLDRVEIVCDPGCRGAKAVDHGRFGSSRRHREGHSY